MSVPCSICGEPVQNPYREVTGWEKPRAQGGANQITLRQETGRYACTQCILLKRTGREGQEQLV